MQLSVLLLFGPAAEELFTRGWLQGFLQPLRTRLLKLGPISMSVPVLTGALAFGAMHLKVGFTTDVVTGVAIVIFSTSLGFLAGIARERTGSLLPAIAVHLAGNAGGILGGLVMIIIQRFRGLPLPHLG
jgi:membrane protease YdiL (CAAX protease family)